MATFTQYEPTVIFFNKATAAGDSDVMLRSPRNILEYKAKIDGPSSSKSATIVIYAGDTETPTIELCTMVLSDSDVFRRFVPIIDYSYIMVEITSISGTGTTVTVTADEFKNDVRVN